MLTLQPSGNSVLLHGGKTGVPVYLEMFDPARFKNRGMYVQSESRVPDFFANRRAGTYLLGPAAAPCGSIP